MLKLEGTESRAKWRTITIVLIVLCVFAAGVYMSALYFAPAFATATVNKPIDVGSLSAPKSGDDRIIIPRIGINFPFSEDESSLEEGAQWRSPGSGNPSDGGNMVIAAKRFSLQPTPLETIKKSPFYNVKKLVGGDKILIDYNGKRYGYEVTKSFTATPSEAGIEQRTNDPTLTLYDIGGTNDERTVIQAKRLGEVAVN